MEQNWKVTAAIVALVAVPFGIAVFQDASHEPGDAPLEDVAEAAAPIAIAEEVAAPPAAMPPEFFEDALGAGAGTPVFGGDLTGLAVGMSAEAVPERVERWSHDDLPSRPHTRLELVFRAGALESIQLELPDDGVTAERELSKHWGQPIPALNGGRLYWYDREASLRVALEAGARGRALLTYERFQTLDELLAHDGERFAFERIPLVGASAADAVDAYADELRYRGDDNLLAGLPPTELSTGPILLRMLVADGEVTGYELVIEDNRADRALLLLERGFGPATPGDAGSFAFESGAELVTTSYPDADGLTVRVAP